MKDLVLKKKYEDILSSNGIKDEISSVKIILPEHLIGEHMASICEYATVEFQDGKRPTKELFIKRAIPMSDPTHMEMFKLTMINEGAFLTSFVSEMKELCESKLGADNDVDMDNLFPKVYLANDSEIIMENMAVQGYYMLNKKEMQNFEMASLVMRSLAKLHGVSYCLIKRAGGKREDFIKKYPNFNEMMFSEQGEEMISGMFEPAFGMLLTMMEENTSKSVLNALDKLKQYQGKIASTMVKAVADPALFLVVNHGDCWNNNMMFSPETKKNPDLAKLMFVDLQMGRVGSPCLDLGYYIYTSVQREARGRVKELLKIYFDSISNLVERLGEEFPYTFEEFLKEFGLKSKLGLFTGLIMTCALDSIKNHDTSKGSGNMMEDFQNLMTTWMKENPHKADDISIEAEQKVSDFEILGKL